MSEWQPIETAPKDGKFVLLGRWFASESTTGKMVWSETTGRVWSEERGSFPWSGSRWIKTFNGDYYSHWKPLPEPPR